MEDLKKAYNTVEEYKDELASVGRQINYHIEKCFEDFFTEEEHLIINEAREIADAPYHYRINEDAYIMGRESEAEEKEIENANKVKAANELISKFLEKMPSNMKITYLTIKKFQDEQRNKNRR
jgi:hypothetical protein